MKQSSCLPLLAALLATGLPATAQSTAAVIQRHAVLIPLADARAVRNVGIDEFEKLAKETNHVILDVRTAKEFADGHLPGAVNLDFFAKDFDEKVRALDRNKSYLVHCASGGRSAKAAGKMTQSNFGAVYNLEGGYKAWEKAGKKVEK